MKKEKYSFEDFKGIMETLLGNNGCPWDKAQTHESLRRYMIEECYEVVDAIDKGDNENLCEELGDVLLQVVFHAQLAQDNGEFNIDDVIDGVARKMINRHPHIFADEIADTKEDVLKNWEQIKKEEKGYKTDTEILRSIPKSLPDIIRAEKILSKVEKMGFPLGNFDENIKKLEQDIENLKQLKNNKNEAELYKIGEILFRVINISRILQINSVFVLTNELETFINRFEYIENTLMTVGKAFEDTNLEDMSVLWNESRGYPNI